MLPEINLNRFTFCACPVETFIGNEILARATAFFWQHGDQIYLVSNWHVLSGRNPKTGQSKEKDGSVPDGLKVKFTPRHELNLVLSLGVHLTNDAGQPLWIQHSTHGQKADLAAVNITRGLARLGEHLEQPAVQPHCTNNVMQAAALTPQIANDVFVLGFPFGMSKTLHFPIWKRGSIASEYDFGIDQIPCFLIDTATREGMSGSPVLLRRLGGQANDDGGFTLNLDDTKFLGVYSGRYIGGLDEMQLGIVWKARLIEELVSNSAVGRYDIIIK